MPARPVVSGAARGAGDRPAEFRPRHRAGRGSRPHRPARVAACGVLLGHYNLHGLYSVNLFVFHDAAVDIFFALSSFTLFLVYGERRRMDWRSFAVARFARVYPLYFLVTLLGVYLNARFTLQHLDTAAGHDLLKHLASQLLLTAELPIPSIMGCTINALWSVPVEAYCYLLMFPVLHWFSPRVASPANLLVVVVAATASVVVLYVRHFTPGVIGVGLPLPADAWAYWVPLLRGCLMFTAGWAAFTVYEREPSTGRLLGIAADALAVLCLAIVIGGESLGVVRKHAVVMAAPFLIVGLMDGRSLAARLLSCPPIHLLGKISYSIYLLHMPIYIAIIERFPAWQATDARRMLTPMAITLVAALLSYNVVEDPARRAIRWLLDRRAGRGAAPVRLRPGQHPP